MSRTRRSVLAVAAGAVGSVVVTLTGFVTTPVLLRYLGSERFGAFRAAIDWFGYAGLLEFGVGGALMAVFARAFGTDNRTRVAAGVRAGLRAYLLVGLLMFASAVLLRAVMPGLIRAPADLAGEVRTGCGVFLIGCGLLPLAVFDHLPRPISEDTSSNW